MLHQIPKRVTLGYTNSKGNFKRTTLSTCVTSKGTIKSGHFMVESGHFDLFYGQKWTTLSVCVTSKGTIKSGHFNSFDLSSIEKIYYLLNIYCNFTSVFYSLLKYLL